MSVRVNIHSTHRQYTGGRKSIDVEGRTIGECLSALSDRYPDMRKILYHPDGTLNRLIEIYLNMASTYPDELKTTVRDGDEIQITLMLAGG
jgi:adenylyltransferase/sulfurtransferase